MDGGAIVTPGEIRKHLRSGAAWEDLPESVRQTIWAEAREDEVWALVVDGDGHRWVWMGEGPEPERRPTGRTP